MNIHFSLAEDLETDNWIRKHADYVLATDSFTDDVFFDKNNIHLDRPAHLILYDENPFSDRKIFKLDVSLHIFTLKISKINFILKF